VAAGSGFVQAAALGVAVGVVSSLSNALAAPAARFASYLLNSGWVWAAVAVAAGWRLSTRGRGAVAGMLALLATTTAYYVLDSILREESVALYWYEMRVWWVVSAAFGSVLGVVGASIRSPGVSGLLARLVVPVGAAAEMVWLPRWGHTSDPDPMLELLRVAVWIASALVVVALASAAVSPSLNRTSR
jgi:hypothetical protein